jgi:hypothetical protein
MTNGNVIVLNKEVNSGRKKLLCRIRENGGRSDRRMQNGDAGKQ